MEMRLSVQRFEVLVEFLSSGMPTSWSGSQKREPTIGIVASQPLPEPELQEQE